MLLALFTSARQHGKTDIHGALKMKRSGGIPLEKIEIQFTLFSAFYSPLIATMAGGFLRDEGIDASWSVSPAGRLGDQGA